MKLFMNVAAGAALMLSANVFASDAVPTSMSCSDFKPTADAQARFAELKGACEEIVAMNGHYYAKVSAVVRKVQGNTVTLNITKTNNTVTMTPNSDLRVLVAGSKTRPRDLKKGQVIHIYLSTDEFTQPTITDVALVQDHRGCGARRGAGRTGEGAANHGVAAADGGNLGPDPAVRRSADATPEAIYRIRRQSARLREWLRAPLQGW